MLYNQFSKPTVESMFESIENGVWKYAKENPKSAKKFLQRYGNNGPARKVTLDDIADTMSFAQFESATKFITSAFLDLNEIKDLKSVSSEATMRLVKDRL